MNFALTLEALAHVAYLQSRGTTYSDAIRIVATHRGIAPASLFSAARAIEHYSPQMKSLQVQA